MKCVFFFKQKTAYEMRISDWSSDVCSSDLQVRHAALAKNPQITNVLVTTGVGVVVLETCHRDRSVPAIRLAWISMSAAGLQLRSEERRVGKECAVRVDIGRRRIIKKNTDKYYRKARSMINGYFPVTPCTH